MASGPITSWQIEGETVETVADIILGGSSIRGIFQVRAPEWGAIAFSTTEYQIESLLSILFSVYISVPIYPISLAPITISLFSMTVMEERMTQRSGSLHS